MCDVIMQVPYGTLKIVHQTVQCLIFKPTKSLNIYEVKNIDDCYVAVVLFFLRMYPMDITPGFD